jgi:predicted acylesterase/phospholipase RssA
VSEPAPQKRVFKVLSIDGGGIKGLYTAAMLSEMEKALAKQSGHSKLGDYFDLIGGTSTGALIAAAIASGKTCAEILNAYREMGQKVFPDTKWLWKHARNFRQNFLGARYSNARLKESLKSLIGDTKFSQARNYLLIPVTNLINYTARIYKTKHSVNHCVDDCLLRDIALASGSAPSFFPIVDAPDIPRGLYADGGLVANNPTMLCALEALTVFVGPESERHMFDQLAILSLGSYGSPTGLFTFPFTDSVVRSKSAVGWILPQKGNLPLISVLMDSQTALTATSTSFLQRSNPSRFIKYVRRDGRTGAREKPRATPQAKLLSFGLTDARKAAMEELEGFGKQDGQTDSTDSEIRFFFESARQPITLFR